MRNRWARRTGLAAVAVLLALVSTSGPAFADDTTGSVSGIFTDSHGNPITNGLIEVWTPGENDFVGFANTDDAGAYTVADIPPGDYIVDFAAGNIDQWAHQKRDPFDATTFTVQAGATTTIDEEQLPTGTLTGTLTNADGSPAAGVSVEASSVSDGDGRFSQTSDDGTWSIPVYSGDSYTVGFTLENGLVEYAPGTASLADAEIYAVAADQTVTVDDQLLQTGTISGRYLKADGEPDANAEVDINFTDGSTTGFTSTDANGNYQVTVFPGSYNVSFFGSDNKQQYAFGQLSQETAAVINVTAGNDTTVNDTQIATGTVTVTATDAATGAAIARFCAFADGEQVCSKGTGVAVLTNVRAGDETVFIDPNSDKYMLANADHVSVSVIAGQNVDATLAFQPAAVIRTTIVDAATGAPVANACVLPFVPGFSVWPDFSGYCSDSKGKVSIGPLFTNSYTLFVSPPRESTYGAQWVGRSGGTGQERDARVIDATVGQTTKVPPIELDQAGTVTGQVTSAADGTPIANALVGPNPFTPGSGAQGQDVGTDASGHYTISNLGPYQWPIFTMANGFASTWTGGVGNRYQAQTVQVTAGASVANDVAMSSGAPLRGKALKADGTPIAEGGYVVAYNAKTGDVMAFAFANPDGTFSMPILPGQHVRIAYLFFDETTNTEYDGYFGGTSEATAQVIGIPDTGKHIRIVMIPGDNR